MALKQRRTDWLVFDLGGVLFDFHGVAGVSRLAGLTPDAAHQAFVTSPAVHAFETGQIEAAEFATRFAGELGISLNADDMLAAFASWEAGPKPGAIEMLATLRDQGPIACLTNNNPVHWGRLSARDDVQNLFDRCYTSHEIGLHKPDPRIFAHVAADLDVPARAITYFDDRLDIVESASAFGFTAHQATSPEEILAVLGAG